MLILQELGAITISRPPSVKSLKSPAVNSALADSSNLQTENEKAPSIISVNDGDSLETVRQGQDDISLASPPLPPKEFVRRETKEDGTDALIRPKASEGVPATSSSFATALANGITSAVRFVINTESSFGTVSTAAPSNGKQRHHHALLLADIATIDERPHVKYEWTIGKRLKFSCTVYHAKQFDGLRKRCRISDLFMKSLGCNTN